jgi:hypothetical protein
LPVISVHSSSFVQAAHTPALQADAVAPVQSACFKHAKHCPAALSQNGFALSLQLRLPVHSTQVLDAASQAGFGVVQSPLFVHSTQVFVAVLQTGVVPVQSPSQGAAPEAPASPAPPMVPPSPPSVPVPEGPPPGPLSRLLPLDASPAASLPPLAQVGESKQFDGALEHASTTKLVSMHSAGIVLKIRGKAIREAL